MKNLVTYFVVVLLSLAIAERLTHAQSLNPIGSFQQNQRSGLGQSAFGTTNQQSGFGLVQQGLGSSLQGRIGGSQQGPFGQANGLGRQGFNQNQGLVGGQDGFVGSDAQQVRDMQRARNPRQGRRALFDFAIESLNEMRESRRERDAQRNQTPPVRVRLRPLFAVGQPSTAALSSNTAESLNKALPNRAAAARVSVQGNEATIQGAVSSEYDKQLAAKVLSLQPGIYEVNNQLTVEPGQAVSPQSGLRLAPAR